MFSYVTAVFKAGLHLNLQYDRISVLSHRLLKDSAYRQNGTVSGCANLDTGLFVAGMDNLSPTNVNTDMAIIADQVTGLGIAVGYAGAGAALLRGSTGQIVTEILVHTVDKS